MTALCYPTYREDTDNFKNVKVSNLTKTRMQPPLIKFRLGELYGSGTEDHLAIIQSISYGVPDNVPWETNGGERVPKVIDAGLTMKLLHYNTPDTETRFFGINAS